MCEEAEEVVGVGVEDKELGPAEEEEVFSVEEEEVFSAPTTTLPVGMRAGGGSVGCALVMFRFVSTSCGSVVLISVITEVTIFSIVFSFSSCDWPAKVPNSTAGPNRLKN